MPVGGTPRIPFRIIRLTPHKTECFSTHPYSREAALHGLSVEWIERREALRQTDLPQVGRALGGTRLGQVRARLRRSHDFLIYMKLRLFSQRQLPHCGVIGATGEYHDGAQ